MKLIEITVKTEGHEGGIKGKFINVEEISITQSNETKLDFKLQDTAGQYVECSALGRHADNACLMQGNEVVLYFATAQAGLRNRNGLLWLYDDSHVATLGHHIVTAPLRQLCSLAT